MSSCSIQPWRPSLIWIRSQPWAFSRIFNLVPWCRTKMLLPVVLGALFTFPMLFMTIAESELFARTARSTENRKETIVKKRMQHEIMKLTFLARLPPKNLKARKNIRVAHSRTSESLAHPLEDIKSPKLLTHSFKKKTEVTSTLSTTFF